jgi:two-component system OmpR family response regulator
LLLIIKRSKMGLPVQTAMIIDDDDDLGQLLSAILEIRKIHVLIVNTLDEAEECLAYLKPTVIFLDNNFPAGLGINFIQKIKSFDAEIRIIMMTADSSTWIREKAIEEGIDYFLRKPFSKKAIDHVLDKLNFRKIRV